MAKNDELRRRFDQLAKDLQDLRALALGEVDADPDWEWRRLAKFLGSFYQAPDQRLLPSQARAAALAAGYDPRGTAGFYSGHGPSLKAEGDWRVLTDAGRKLYEEYRHLDDRQ
jgi:hypothetical protein